VLIQSSKGTNDSEMSGERERRTLVYSRLSELLTRSNSYGSMGNQEREVDLG
jgi:hypothetical protein